MPIADAIQGCTECSVGKNAPTMTRPRGTDCGESLASLSLYQSKKFNDDRQFLLAPGVNPCM